MEDLTARVEALEQRAIAQNWMIHQTRMALFHAYVQFAWLYNLCEFCSREEAQENMALFNDTYGLVQVVSTEEAIDGIFDGLNPEDFLPNDDSSAS